MGTAYTDEVNGRLAAFLETSGFEVASMLGLGLSAIEDIQAVGEAEVSALAMCAAEAAGEADAVLVSCGGLPALHLAGDVEDRLDRPVIASSTAGVWGAVRLLGRDAAAPALGRLARIRERTPGAGAPA